MGLLTTIGTTVGTAVLTGTLLSLCRNLLKGPRTAGAEVDDGASDEVLRVRKKILFQALVALLTTMDDLLWIGTFKWVGYLFYDAERMRSLPYPDQKGVRCLDPTTPLKTDCAGANTVYEILCNSVDKHGSRNAFGTRTYLGTTEPHGPKKHTKKIFGETTWRTYDTVGERTAHFGSALRHVGAEPCHGAAAEFESQPLGKHCIMIYENTCDDWATGFLGAVSQSVVVATSYATLGFDAMLESVEETGSCLLLCNRSVVDQVAAKAKGSKVLRTIVYTNNYVHPDEAATSMPTEQNGIKIFSMEEFLDLGKANPVDSAPPNPATLAVIMYTSGSTGKPKGVMLTQQNLTAAVGGTHVKLVGSGVFQLGEEVYLAYLPAAHILELVAEITFISMGGAIGYADPRTISSKGAARQKPSGELNETAGGAYPPGAIQEFRPTLMAGVPKVWDTLKAAGLAAIAKKSPMVAAIIAEFIACRDTALRSGTDTPLFGFIFSTTMGPLVGGRIKTVLSGGGPLSSKTQAWVRCTLCPIFIQGYGLTETSGATAAQDLDEVRDGIAGSPIGCVDLRLVSVHGVRDTAGNEYLTTDTEHVVKKVSGVKQMPCIGRGELWIRGPSVAPGYFKLPEKTKSEWTDDGWFKTGDICIWTVDGSIKVVDRLKNLVKLRGGEYVAIENMEKEYAQSAYVDQLNGGVMVVADGKMDRPCLLVQANTSEINKLATKLGIDGSVEELCRHAEVAKAVRESMVETAMTGLSPLEKIAAVKLLPGSDSNDAPLSETAPWTIENGGMLASNKLGRKAIQNELESLVYELRQHGIFN